MTAAPADRQSLVMQRHEVRRFQTDYNAPGLARRHVAATLQAWNLADLIDTAGLLVSELVTNACRASFARQESADIIAARLTRTDVDLIIEVWDSSSAAPVRQDPALDAEGGRGLLLVSALSTRWAYYRPPTGGKVTWCSLPLPAKTDVAAGNAEPLPSRQRPARAAEPIEVFDDLATLQCVADALRALDWDLPPGEGVGR
ncbi:MULTISPECIES: ATP-binding protein [unclassified Frankia]|uniref:ATP-binding protein n=1 Tax=unclassified Frankia TaxID=2632575 RepID=UPI001EF41FFB|nr:MULTISPECIES: ATP-binding protein [unclassified Frankia]